MSPERLKPFVDSVHAVFDKMLHTAARQQDADDGPAVDADDEVFTSVIGISGAATGVVALSFPTETAKQLASRMLDDYVSEINDEAIDALAELANMVGGWAKARLGVQPSPDLSLPMVVEGSKFRMRHASSCEHTAVPFTCAAGAFKLEVTFNPN